MVVEGCDKDKCSLKILEATCHNKNISKKKSKFESVCK